MQEYEKELTAADFALETCRLATSLRGNLKLKALSLPTSNAKLPQVSFTKTTHAYV